MFFQRGIHMENLKIYRLTPERLDDYLYFFENVAHTDNKEWDRCYCLNYCSAHNAEVVDFDLFDAEQRREYAIKYVREGVIQGYLAYHNGQVIGWCNANDRSDCMRCYGWQQYIAGKGEMKQEASKIKSIFCFTVAPEMRGKHVATALLERVVQDAREDGYEYLEAYPNKEDTDMFYNYVGPVGLYQKFGFEKYGETDERFIFRKKL